MSALRRGRNSGAEFSSAAANLARSARLGGNFSREIYAEEVWTG
ncbi:hypothetical protein [Campylobacter sp.]|nr:hypothetical protein [Campylobacter sp.]MDO4674944.1 hypothetical protein [Campylobacter sp.]